MRNLGLRLALICVTDGFWLSQGRVAKVKFRWDGWNSYHHMCHSFWNQTVKAILKSVDFWWSYRQTERLQQLNCTASHTVTNTAAHQLKVMWQHETTHNKLECGPMPNLMVALPNIGGALCSTLQSLADAHYQMPYSNAAKTQNPLKFVGVSQTPEPISAVSGPKFTILWGHVEDILLLNKFFSDCRHMP